MLQQLIFKFILRKLLIISLIVIFAALLFQTSFAQVQNDYRTIASGNWSNLGIWQFYDTTNADGWKFPPHYPAAGDNIIAVSVGHTITLDNSSLMDQLIVGGTVTVNAGSALNITNGQGADLTLTGTINGAGDLNIPSGVSVDISQGTLSGTGAINVGGILNLTGSSTINRTVNNNGTVNWTAGSVSGSGLIINNTVFNAQCAFAGGFGVAVNNLGTFNKTTNNQNFFSAGFQNSGTVNILSGGILLGTNTGSTALDGVITVSSGGTLQFGNNSGTTYTVNASISGAGSVTGYTTAVNFSPSSVYNISGITSAFAGIMTFNAGMTLTNIGNITPAGGNINLPTGLIVGAYGSQLKLSAGGTFTSNIGTTWHFQKVSMIGYIAGSDSIEVSDSLTMSSGQITGTAAVILKAGGYGTVFNNGVSIDKAFINNGTIDWSANSISGTGTIYNNSIINMTGTANGCFAKVINSGTINKAGSLLSNFSGGLNNTSTGVVNINAMSLIISANSGTFGIAGSVIISANSTFQLGNSSTATFNVTGSISGAGNFTASATNVNFLAGSGYNISGITNANNGTMTFNSGMTLTNMGMLSTTGGTITLQPGLVVSSITQSLSLGGGGIINFNTGQKFQFVNISAGGTIAGSDTINLSGSMTLSNGGLLGTGHFNILSGAVLDINNNGIQITKTINNAGTINWTSGGLSGAGIINNNNILNIAVSANHTINQLVNNTGTINKTLAASPFLVGGFNNSGTVNVTTGTLTLTVNSGTYNLGGAFNVSSGATLTIGQGNGSAINNITGQITGAGNVNIGANTVNFNALSVYNISGNTTVTFGSANFNSAMTLSNLGNFTSSGGTTNFASGLVIGAVGSTLTINPTGLVNFNTGRSYTFNTLTLGGTIAGADSIFVNNSFSWTNGIISNAVVLSSNITTTLNSSNAVTLNGKIINNGTVNWAQSTLSGNGEFINKNIFNINTNSNFSFTCGLTNNGTVNKTTSNINTYGTNFNNNSIINIMLGGMSITTGINTGAINLSNNTTFSINGLYTSYGTINVVPNSFVTGNSLLTYNGPTWVNDGNVSVNVQFDSITSISGSGIFNNISTFLNGSNVTLASNMQFKNVWINSGGAFNVNNYKLSVSGTGTTILANGTFNINNSTVEYNGTSVQGISNLGITYKNLIINNTAGTSIVSGTLNIDDTLKILSGFLNVGNNTLSLGSTGYLIESPGAVVKGGTGSITATRTLTSPVNVNVAGLGATISSTADLGVTTITRGFTNYTINGNGTVLRYYNISPANNSGLNATLTYHYDNTELNGLNENFLSLYRSTNAGTNWTTIGGAKDTANNNITQQAINAFSYWTAGVNPLASSINITAIVDGIYNTSTNTLNKRDTITVYLRNSFAPYAILDSSKILIDSVTFSATAFFNTTPSGTYYYSIKYRNALETWSKSGGENYTAGSSMLYDFTTAQSQSYSNSTIIKNGRYCIISGDLNQDGFVNGNDFTLFSQQFGQTGYLKADLNGDNNVNGNDFTPFSASFGKQSLHP